MALIVRRTPPSSVMLAGAPSGDNAAAAQTKGPDTGWVVAGYVLVGLGAAVGVGLFEVIGPESFVAAAGVSAFAPLYILTQSIERLMEPFVQHLGAATDSKQDKKVKKDEAQAKLEEQIAALHNAGGESAGVCAHYLALLNQIRRNTTVIAWGVASFLGMALCGIFGLQLLSATGLDVPYSGLDVAITGLAVGSGTKPLHDLISNVQKSKDEKSNPGEAATTD